MMAARRVRGSEAAAAPHAPVLLQEMLAAMRPRGGETYLDGTFGAGGYSAALLEAADCRVIALDRDPHVAPHAETMRARYGERFQFIAGRFSEMASLVKAPLDGIVLDIGVSSMQLDEAARGFSFRHDAPLDMRMSAQGMSAAELIATASEAELANLLWEYGEERASRRIASAIVRARALSPITTTAQLRDLIHRVMPPRRTQTIDPATRSFQALRIAVNAELEELQRALAASESLLREGGRLVVVTFHSLEDRIVKRYLAEASATTRGSSRHIPASMAGSGRPALYMLDNRRALAAGELELARNPRARSAKLRAAIRTSAPATPLIAEARDA